MDPSSSSQNGKENNQPKEDAQFTTNNELSISEIPADELDIDIDLDWEHIIFHDYIDNTLDMWHYYGDNVPNFYVAIHPRVCRILGFAYNICDATDERCNNRYREVEKILNGL